MPPSSVSYRDKVFSVLTIQQAERFWPSVAVCAHGDLCRLCCWAWQGQTSGDGYGRVYLGPVKTGTRTNAHRLAYLLTYGEIPAGLLVCHTCDHPSCCNPGHLWLGTVTDNNHDRDQKGHTASGERQGFALHPESRPRGERNGRARLSEQDVLQIRRLTPFFSYAALGRSFGVTKGMIRNICRGWAWKHLLPPKESTDE